jgi:hypothetical protein
MQLRSTFHGSPKPSPREFPLTLEMQYQVTGDEMPHIRGTGRTMWMSSREIIFQCDAHLPSGTDVEMTIAWPARLDNSVGLQLCIRARVLRTLAHGVTAEIRKYQFRTRRLTKAMAAGASDEPASHPSQRLAAGGYAAM